MMLRSLAFVLALSPAAALAQARPEPPPTAAAIAVTADAPAAAASEATTADPPAPPQSEPPPTPPPADAIPTEPDMTAAGAAAPADAPPVAVPPAGQTEPPTAAANGPAAAEQQRFEQFRRDLVSLLALRADPALLVAAAELAYPDAQDKHRTDALKSPSLIKRAQRFGPDTPLVWWVSTFLECGTKAPPCLGDAAERLQKVAGDNAAAWLPTLHATKDAGQQRALLASMAQATRFDDFWTAGVVAVYRALQTLSVPAEVLSHGLNPVAARVNLATSVGGAFLPNYARLGNLCNPQASADEALVSDCLAVAHLLENGGSFRSQSVGFGIEDNLLPAGTARDVLRARQRASLWQRQQFLELSARFPRDEALAQSYMDLLQQNGDELTTVTALLRSRHVATDAPAGWQPPQANPTSLPGDPRAIPLTH
ncbi:MAG TPA: hypothetical protein VGH81_11420 [Rudaea sp.]